MTLEMVTACYSLDLAPVLIAERHFLVTDGPWRHWEATADQALNPDNSFPAV